MSKLRRDTFQHLQPTLEQFVQAQFFEVIAQAYERTSVIITTNLPFDQWSDVLLSKRMTGAALDRLTHRCHILEATGDSYRIRSARKGTKATSESRQT